MTLTVLVGVIAPPRPSAAQIVNVQPLIDESKDPGFSAALEASVDWRSGNTRLLAVRGAAMARWLTGDHLVFGIVKGEHGESGAPSTTFVSRSFEHVRYRHQATPMVAVEAFAQNETDRFRRLRLRALLGAGPRLRLIDDEHGSLHLGAAPMLEHERLSSDDAAGAGDTQTVVRVSSYLTGRATLDPRLTATISVYLQPRVDAFDEVDDVRSLAEAALLFEITKRLRFKIAVSVAHDSRPPPETEATDTVLYNAVTISL